MNWKFWKTKETDNIEKIRSKKLKKPRELPDAVGRKLVVEWKIDPDEAWALRYVSRPSESRPGIQDFRLFHPKDATHAGLVVKDWYSLDGSSDLILYEGQYNKSEKKVALMVTHKSAA
jgi:hypothetical protein